jgi:hypothetical protein
VAEWLSGHGIAAEAYSGDSATEARVAVEERLLRNDLKAVVATSALGMGYDKPDLGFVVHYQAPGSVISYYQQVGRAGRAIERAEVVLLRGREDKRIQDFFIEQAFPRRELVDRVLERIADGGATTQALMAEVNLGKGRVDAMLKVLDVEGAVERDGSTWLSRPGSGWEYDAERYERITALRRREQEAMAQYGEDGRCLMRALQEELDDPDPQDCGRCAVCAGPRFAEPLDPELVRGGDLHLRSKPVLLEVKKMAPTRTARCASSPTTSAPRRAARSRGSATAAGIPRCRRGRRAGASTTSSSTRRRSCCGTGRRRAARAGSPRCRRTAAVRWCRTSRSGWPRRRAALRAGVERARDRPPAARDGQLAAAGRQRARRLRGQRPAAGRALACSSTTCASAAGRSPCSPASCAATACRPSTRWRSPRRSERPAAALPERLRAQHARLPAAVAAPSITVMRTVRRTLAAADRVTSALVQRTVSVARPGPPDTTAPLRPDDRPAYVTAAVAVHASLHATVIRTPTASRRSRSCVLDSAIDSSGRVLSSGTVPAAASPTSRLVGADEEVRRLRGVPVRQVDAVRGSVGSAPR